MHRRAFLASLALLGSHLLVAESAGALHPDPRRQHEAPWTLDGTRIHMRLRPQEHGVAMRVVLRGHARVPTHHLEFKLYPGLRVEDLRDAEGRLVMHRHGEDLDVQLPSALAAGERFHVIMDLAGFLHDPARGAGPHRDQPPSAGFGPHLDAGAGLVLPRESFWYPRPAWADPQEIALQIETPQDWVVVARMTPEHDVPLATGRRLHRLSTQGVVPRPVGLAAGAYRVDEVWRDELLVRVLTYPLALAEQPDVRGERLRTLRELLDHLAERYGPPGRGRFDLVQLAGASVRREAPTFLGQGSFAWVQSPRGRVEPRETFFVARELARAWWERGVQMASWERAGLIQLAGMLAVRRLHGEPEFLALCREVAHEHGAEPRPGQRLLPLEAEELRVPPRVPTRHQARVDQTMLLLGYLQRLGEDAVATAMREFTAAYMDRRASFAEFVDLLDAREWARREAGRLPGG
jgi:hypothetical protein